MPPLAVVPNAALQSFSKAFAFLSEVKIVRRSFVKRRIVNVNSVNGCEERKIQKEEKVGRWGVGWGCGVGSGVGSVEWGEWRKEEEEKKKNQCCFFVEFK